jgi:uncharacterized protein (DUF2342 family)
MARGDEYDVRSEMLRLLLGKVASDTYPSTTMLDMIEKLLTPQEVPAYAEVLMDKIRGDRFPSVHLMKRVMALG